MAFTLPPLPYAADALAPHISAETMAYHYGKHHKTYVDTLNTLLPNPEHSLEDTIRNSFGLGHKTAIFNNAAQIWNHDFYWQSMKPGGGGAPTGSIKGMIDKTFGSYENFKDAFASAGKGQFGSGWVWLVLNEKGKLDIQKSSNANTPLTQDETKPLMTMDVWEHAYYIDFRNKRPDYINIFLDKLVNWDFVEKNLDQAG